MSGNPSDAEIIRAIDRARTIAIVGASNDPIKPSLFVATYFKSRGKRIIPVNPRRAGERLLGETILGDLSDIPSETQVDMVDIFRRAEFVPAIVEQAIELFAPGLQTIWMQFGVRHEDAARRAREAGLLVVQDRCPKVEHMRLSGAPNPFGLRGGVSSRLR